jgi:hypothetical protein
VLELDGQRAAAAGVAGDAGVDDGVEVDQALADEQPGPLRLRELRDVVDEPAHAVRVALDLGQRDVLVVGEAVAHGLDAREHARERAAQLVRDVVGRRAAHLVLAAQRRGQAIERVGQPRDLAPAARARRPGLDLPRAHPPRDLREALQRPGEVERQEQRDGEREAAGEQARLEQQAAHPRLEAVVEALRGVVGDADAGVVGDHGPDMAAAHDDRRALTLRLVGRRGRGADHRPAVGAEHDDLVTAAAGHRAQRRDGARGPAARLEVRAGGHLGRVRRREAQVAVGEVAQLGVHRAVDEHGAEQHARDREQRHRGDEVDADAEGPRAPHAGSTPSR